MCQSPLRDHQDALELFSANKWLALSVLKRMNAYQDVRALGDLGRQEAFIGLWRCCLIWDASKGTLGTLAFVVIRRRLIVAARAENQAGRAIPVSQIGDADLLDSIGRSEEVGLDHDELQQLAAAMGSLDPRSRRIVRAHYGLGGQAPLSLAEIGEQIGVSRERVRQLLHVALENLRAVLQPAA